MLQTLRLRGLLSNSIKLAAFNALSLFRFVLRCILKNSELYVKGDSLVDIQVFIFSTNVKVFIICIAVFVIYSLLYTKCIQQLLFLVLIC